ncbi:MAG: metallophosphoesterase [Oscillospiraceae bacterium]|nr:metallophosphoesterase [Oscillospiraceae bacterium]
MNKAGISIGGLAAGAAAVTVFLHWQNNGVRTSRYVYSDHRLPQGFKGFKILHISDYHNSRQMHRKIINLSRAEGADITAITGDLFDCRRTDVAAGLALVKDLVKIAPVYYVTGNHESKIENIAAIKEEISRLGVNIIEDKKIRLERNGDAITLMGVQDPRFYIDENDEKRDRHIFRNHLLNFTKGDDSFKVLLSHRPEFIHTYRDSGIALALTGHAHGGQFSIPFTDIGVFVPNQGLFPPYAAGMKKLDGTTMIISRGIGNSVFPFRLFNRPEIVTVEFE